MNKITLLLAALFFCVNSPAQGEALLPEPEFYGPWDIEDSSEYYVFANLANIRSEPRMSASLVDSLHAGDEVFVISQMHADMQLNGIMAPWAKISYKRNAVAKEGYIWSGLLSFRPLLRRSDTKFIYGVEKKLSKDTASEYGTYTMSWYDARLKVIRNSQKVAEAVFHVDASEGGSYVSAEISNGKGLDNILQVSEVSMGGGACGVGTHTVTHMWNGKELYALPQLYEVGDAGVHYYTEQFIFPTDKGGKPGIIIWTSEEADATEKLDKTGEPIFKTTKKRKQYTWDGQKLSPR